MLKKKVLEEMISVRLEKSLHADLLKLKASYGVDTGEWIRSLIRSNLPALKKQIIF